ncbi:MAG: NAD kinase [Burkholderiaceae bacterium]|jgi:NAD+ kinase|nr:NAD kinase [Burkholderiaceae bacterium]HMN66443.1 NAD kinase [Burkholderiaceae bacterium]
MKSRFNRVALVSRPQTESVGGTVREIAAFLRARGVSVLVEERSAVLLGASELETASLERIGHEADLAIAIGGDGTMLGAARALAPHEVPLVGINHGRLGFITDIGLDSWRQALSSILEGHYASEERTLLTARVVRGQEVVWTELALNDVVVNRSSRTGMIELQVHVDDLYMYSQRADGLIVATPTGSTAYALSANGPILHPQIKGIVLVPVAPQSLSNRPITLPDDVTITIRVVEGREPRVAGDMQVFSDLQVGDDIIVQRAAFTTTFLHPPGYSYFATLRGKLNWHELPHLQTIQR